MNNRIRTARRPRSPGVPLYARILLACSMIAGVALWLYTMALLTGFYL